VVTEPRESGRREEGGVVAEFSVVRPGVRIFIFFLLLVVLTVGGVIWFDYLGLVDAKGALSPVYRLLGFQRRGPVASADDPNLLDRERLAKQADSLTLRAQEQDTRETVLAMKEKELGQLAEDLKDRESAIEAREKAFNEQVKAFENRRVNLVQNAKYLVSMPPANAKDILLKMDDQDIIDVLRVVEDEAKKAGEDSVVAYWLSIMPADRAATLQRKMARKAGG
jgi:flagellar protein FlbB